MGPIEVVLISGALTVFGSTLAWFLARRDKREDRKASSATPGVPTVQEIWIRQDTFEKIFRSGMAILGEVAEQLPDDFQPVLSRRHVAILAESGYLPKELERFITDERG